MSVDDHLSIVRFHGLVDKCRDKKEILDLCEKALQKYRPEVFETKKSMLTKKSVLYGDLQVHSTNKQTNVLKARYAIDRLYLNVDQQIAASHEIRAKSAICQTLSCELIEQKLIKFSVDDNFALDQRIFVGKLEVVVP